ncbi:hypothetical protein E4U43_001031 [Claviceps pusilla]|uniref:Uncharacterized protein n=1 Tax=Claviceps pusilla TaxID=123648 RepID=A0A9P7NAI8_9HYPO|nr:hypothetical protein E4U43_001031 [Claviceps pusilla]
MKVAGSYSLEPLPGDLHIRLPQLDSSSEALDHRLNESMARMESLLLQAPTSVRTLFIILASSNALAGAATAVGIYWDCYQKSRSENPSLKFKSSFWKLVGPAETFPFVLSLFIVGQGIVFAVAQAFELQSSLPGCETISRILLLSTAFLFIPYTYLAFGIEAIIQALRPHNPFASRHKWTLPACLAIPILGSIGTYVFNRFSSPPKVCAASVVVFLLRPWGLGCFGIIVGIASALLLGSGVIFYRLFQVCGISARQRMVASWMASFMVVGSFSMTITIPFLYSVSANNGSRTSSTTQWQSSMAAMVIVNLGGVITGLFYVVLRATKIGTTIPEAYQEFYSPRWMRRLRIARLPSLASAEQMEQPLPLPAAVPSRQVGIFEARGQIGIAERAASPDANTRNGGQNGSAVIENAATVDIVPTTGTCAPAGEQKSSRKSSYRLFPRDNVEDAKSRLTLPATVRALTDQNSAVKNPFADEILAPPMTIFSGETHNRASSSSASFATVPIGLRVSNIHNIGLVQSFYQIHPSTASTHQTLPVFSDRVPLDPRPRPRPRPLINPDVDLGVEIVQDKQLPPVPLSFTKKVPQRGPEAALKQPPLPPGVYTRDRKAPSRSIDGKDHVRCLPTSMPDINEAEWI